jgi:hypothetical protein
MRSPLLSTHLYWKVTFLLSCHKKCHMYWTYPFYFRCTLLLYFSKPFFLIWLNLDYKGLLWELLQKCCRDILTMRSPLLSTHLYWKVTFLLSCHKKCHMYWTSLKKSSVAIVQFLMTVSSTSTVTPTTYQSYTTVQQEPFGTKKLSPRD